MTTPLRIAVTGLAATYPYGGVAWDYLQYPLGLQRLGHDVHYIEDAGKWCYDPIAATFVADGRRNAARLARSIAALDDGLQERWFFRDAAGKTYGRPWPEVAAFCRGADLFLHLSFSCQMREEYYAAERVVFIDSDPIFTQAAVPGYLAGTIDAAARARVDEMRRHDAFFTFGENVGAPDCRIPTALFNWRPTRQPVVLDRFAASVVSVSDRRRTLTTVASWKPSEAPAVIDGIAYGGKGHELMRFVDLPRRSALPLELALNGLAPTGRLRAHGWRLVDPDAVSGTPWDYRDYLAHSSGEWSVAKHGHVKGRTGWFSGRTACYLALGVPAVVQDTGFSRTIPVGEGVMAFATLDEAVAAIEQLAANPERHARAARDIAHEFFDANRVLSRLIEDAMRSDRSRFREAPRLSIGG